MSLNSSTVFDDSTTNASGLMGRDHAGEPLLPKTGRLAFTLIAPFLGVIALLGLAAASLFYLAGRNAVQQVASDQVGQITQRIEESTSNHLKQPELVARTIASAISTAQVDINDQLALEQLFWRTKSISQSANYIYFGRPNGDFIGVETNLDEPSSSFVRVRNASTGEAWLGYKAALPGDRAQRVKNRMERYDPRARNWYQQAVVRKSAVWSEVYRSASRDQPIITHAVPVYRNEQLLGVVGIDVNLELLSSFMSSLSINNNGLAFVLDENARVVTTSASKAALAAAVQAYGKGADERADIDVRLAQAWASVMDGLAKFKQRTEGSDHTLWLDTSANDQYLGMRALSLSASQQWVIVVSIPRHELLAPVMRYTNIMSLFGLFAIVLALVIGYFVLRWVSTDLGQLAKAAHEVKLGVWPVSLPTSRSDEIGLLARAFEAMAIRLRGQVQGLELDRVRLEGRVAESSLEHTSRMDAQQAALRAAEQAAFSFEQVLEQSSDPIAVFDLAGGMTYSNPAFETVMSHLGSNAHLAVQRLLSAPLAAMQLLAQQSSNEFAKRTSQSITQPLNIVGQIFRRVYPIRRSESITLYFDVQASPIREPGGKIVGFTMIMRDATSSEKQRATLERTVRLDSLTGLYNRDAAEEEIARLINGSDAANMVSGASPERSMSPFAVLFIDMDAFKSVNDALGHDAGDRLLKAVGKAIFQSVRPGDFAARIGGDEFLAVLPGISSELEAQVVAERMVHAIAVLKDALDIPSAVTCSIGVALRSSAAQTASELIQLADAAMYEAKRQGKNRISLSARKD